MYQPKADYPLSLDGLKPPPGGSGLQPPKTEGELRDEVQALRRQVRELQHERDTAKRKYEGLQAVVSEFLRRATRETVLDIESLQDFLQRTP